MSDVGIAVVGAGFAGPIHVEALRRLGLAVTGILGCDREESRSARDSLRLPKAYESLEEILEDDAVRSVHLAVPNVLHYEMTKKVLAAGRHVMCEKPLAMNSSESRELVDLAAAAELCAGVCYNVRYYPLNLEASDMARRGDLGEIYSINGSYTQDWLFYDTDYNWRVLAEQGGELRAVADIGTHWMDLVRMISGLRIEAVFADLKTIHKVRKRPLGEVATFAGKVDAPPATEPIGITTDDYGGILFRFGNGARGSLWVSQAAAGRKNCIRYEIAGSKCTLAWNSESPNELWIGRREKSNELLPRDPALVADEPRGYINYPAGANEGFPDSFKQCFRAFYHSVLGDSPPSQIAYPTFADGHEEILLCEAVLKSHREQRWISLE